MESVIVKALLTYGPLGIGALVMAIVIKALFDRMVVNFEAQKADMQTQIARLTKERDDERDYNRQMEKDFRSDIVPLLTELGITQGQAVKLITEQAARNKLIDELRASREEAP